MKKCRESKRERENSAAHCMWMTWNRGRLVILLYIVCCCCFLLLHSLPLLLHRNSNGFFKRYRAAMFNILEYQTTSPFLFLQFGFYNQKLMDCHLPTRKTSIEMYEYIFWCFPLFVSWHSLFLFVLWFFSSSSSVFLFDHKHTLTDSAKKMRLFDTLFILEIEDLS